MASREQKRPLSNVAGQGSEVSVRGDPAHAVPLAAALRAQDTVDRDELTHGFHAYPARMHPAVARTLLAELPGRTVLDPFCGSGTVAIEALCAGRESLGSDLDPLALQLARVKTLLLTRDQSARIYAIAAQIAQRSEARVRGRVEVRAQLSAEERSWYDVHVLKEMAGLLAEIKDAAKGEPRFVGEALEMVFSSLVIKFSKQRSETAPRLEAKRIRKGLVTEFFLRKTEELTRRWAALAAAAAKNAPTPRFVRSDAACLPETLGGSMTVPLIVTSPPYGGTYDYASHHARRHAWLGMSAKALLSKEMGARRDFARGGRDIQSRWDRQVTSMLNVMARLITPRGLIALLVGDGEIAGQRVAADRQLERLAPAADLEVLAAASQMRPDFHGNSHRREHLVLLGPTS